MAKLDKIREIVRDLETPRICFSPRAGFSMESMADRYNMTIRDTESEIEIQDFADNNKPVTWAWTMMISITSSFVLIPLSRRLTEWPISSFSTAKTKRLSF